MQDSRSRSSSTYYFKNIKLLNTLQELQYMYNTLSLCACICSANFAGAQGAKSWLGGGRWRREDLRNPTQWLSRRLSGGIFEKTAWRKDNTWLWESGFMIFIWYLEITQYVTITPLLPFRSIALMEQTWFHFAIFPNQNQNSEGLYDSRPNKLARFRTYKFTLFPVQKHLWGWPVIQ